MQGRIPKMKRKSSLPCVSSDADDFHGKDFKWKKINSRECLTNKKNNTKYVNMKTLKLMKNSSIDIMLRRQKCEAMEELRKYKSNEMKKIDSHVKDMRHDLLSYMLKEVEEHKKKMLIKMEDEIEEEKCRRVKVMETELHSKVLDEKSVQTVDCPERVDDKYEKILRELKLIKTSSDICQNILSKSSQLNSRSLPSPGIVDNVQIVSQNATSSSDPVMDNYCHNMSKRLPTGVSEVKCFNEAIDKHLDNYQEKSKCVSKNACNGSSMKTSKTLLGKSLSNENLYKRSQSCTKDSTLHCYNPRPDEDEPNSPQNDGLVNNPSSSSYSDNRNVSPMTLDSKDFYIKTESSPPGNSTYKNSTFMLPQSVSSSMNAVTSENSSIHKQMLSSDRNVISNATSMESANSHINNMPISSFQYVPSPVSTVSKSSQFIKSSLGKNLGDARLKGDDNSPSSHHNENPTTKVKSFSGFTNSPSFTLENSIFYNHLNSQDNMFSDKMKFSNSVNPAYDIYTYNKKLISSQEKNKLFGNADDVGMLQVRKKREINKRILEKYGPLHNPDEISEKIQSDPTFLSFPLQEKNGILSCVNRSVAEPITFSKDLLEELFSREVLSISSCKGSPIKTALDPDKLEFIRRTVFFALPSDDEDALWDMIQECIDTKCRGILRNMKKKISKSFEC